MNMNGFIPTTSKIYPRNMLSVEGAAGTITTVDFEDWVENYLLSILGDFSRGEPNSILVMDNASTHCSERVLRLIKEKGTYLLFTAPYSADLNPIELAFNVYKTKLRNLSKMFETDWYNAHLRATQAVTLDICIKEFRRCGVPHSNKVLTVDEKKKLLLVMGL